MPDRFTRREFLQIGGTGPLRATYAGRARRLWILQLVFDHDLVDMCPGQELETETGRHAPLRRHGRYRH